MPARKARRRSTRRIRHALRAVARGLVHAFGPLVLGTLARTWRLTILGSEHLESSSSKSNGHFMALWHGRMLLGLAHHGSRDWWVLVSESQDGAITRALLLRFGYRVIRGSSSRGGARALREMLGVLDQGAVLIITPDGPRGPRHSIGQGLAWMARATGYPIVPVGFACDRAWRMRSWDRFTIPKPWARVVMVYGDPIHVPRSEDKAGLAAATDSVREAILATEERGFAHLGRGRDW